jgi:transcriptional regulator with XRE-family HTH domain
MSQAAFARATGLSRCYVKMIEDGFAQRPSGRAVGLLARALDSNLEEMMEAAGGLPRGIQESPIKDDADLARYLEKRRGLKRESVLTIMRLVRVSALREQLSFAGEGEA